MSRFALTGARIFDGASIVSDAAVVIEDGRIAAVAPSRALAPSDRRVDLEGGLLAPGFIDAQVNGGGGTLFNDQPTPEGARKIAQAHRRHGTTGLLPTVITDSANILRSAVEAITVARRERSPGILGIHIEGPFIDPKRRGAHDEKFIRRIAAHDIEWLSALDCGTVLITVAPSTTPPASIAALVHAGLIVSLGHSEAAADETAGALRAGASGFTHLYNAMSQLAGREPGMVGVALADRDSCCGIIADGHHVDALALKVALAAKPRGKIFLVTDAMPSAAGGAPHFRLQGRPVQLRGGRLELTDGTLAGSHLTMDEAVRFCCRDLGLSLEEALRMASLYPAAFLKLDHAYGRIAQGYLADLVHLDDNLTVRATWIEGQSSSEEP
ncbi:MAG: N-acetylglucosamine-6-phosphate deacetylase [Pseudomonadota bacterium]|nr:N-acetylglucosamine-6-phosphate deacetylase [Pseudomonadota bacterium]